MNAPLITILLPVYYGERTIKATLESLLSQTFTDFEILIGIDGTKDASKAIALGFDDARIKIIEHPQNLGLAQNLNTIIKQASPTSLYYAMAEQDDVYVAERLQWQVDIMKSHLDVGLVSGITEFHSENGVVSFPGILVNGNQFPQFEAMFKYLYVNQLKVVNTCMLWRKSIHKNQSLEFRNTYGNFNVDWDFILRFSLLAKIHGIPKVLVKMNRFNNRVSVTTSKKNQYKASRQLIKDFKHEFPQLIDTKLYKKAKQMHQKIEVGSYSKYKIVWKCIVYYFQTWDSFYPKYLLKRIKQYLQ